MKELFDFRLRRNRGNFQRLQRGDLGDGADFRAVADENGQNGCVAFLRSVQFIDARPACGRVRGEEKEKYGVFVAVFFDAVRYLVRPSLVDGHAARFPDGQPVFRERVAETLRGGGVVHGIREENFGAFDNGADPRADVICAARVPGGVLIEVDLNVVVFFPVRPQLVHVIHFLLHILRAFCISTLAVDEPNALIDLTAQKIVDLVFVGEALQKEENGLIEEGLLDGIADDAHLFDVNVRV